MKNKLIPTLLALFLMLTLTACGGDTEPSGNTDIITPTTNNEDELHDFAKEYADIPGGGLTLGVVNDHELTYDGVVYLDSINDTLNVQFANLTENNREYILKIFYDYKEVMFTMNGSEALQSSHIFTADSMQSMIIPIVLDNRLNFENSHFLTVAVLTSPNVHAVDVDLMTNSYGISITYELTNRNAARQVNEKPTAQEPSSFLQVQYQGLMLNLDFDEKDDYGVLYPPLEIKASSGETIKLAYRVGNYDNADDVLFIVLLDWQQQTLDGNPFIHLANKPNYMGYGEIEITAPLEKGKYEITGFVVVNPFELRNDNNFMGNDTCYRFTLTVE